MARHIPHRPAHGSAYGPTTVEVVLSSLRRHVGYVLDGHALDRFAEVWNVRRRYLDDVLGLFSEHGVVEHVRRELWVIRPDPIMPEDRDTNIELLRAHVAARAAGPWAVIPGMWALLLQGVISERIGLHPDVVRSCATHRPGKLASARRIGWRNPDDAGAMASLPPALANRHATPVLGEPVTTITTPVARVGQVHWIGSDQLGVHVQTPIAATMHLFEHPRVNGGFDAARDVVVAMLVREGPVALARSGAGLPSTAARARLAFAIGDGLARLRGAIDLVDPADRANRHDAGDVWILVQRLLRVGQMSYAVPLDPHRVLNRSHRSRISGTVDNRDAPLAPRAVVMSRAPRS